MIDILEMSVPIQLTNQEWSMILRVLKEKAPSSHNACIYKLEKELREQVNRVLEQHRDGVLNELFDYDPQEAETQEIPIVSSEIDIDMPCYEDFAERNPALEDTQELPILADSVSEIEDGPDYTEGDYLLSG